METYPSPTVGVFTSTTSANRPFLLHSDTIKNPHQTYINATPRSKAEVRITYPRADYTNMLNTGPQSLYHLRMTIPKIAGFEMLEYQGLYCPRETDENRSPASIATSLWMEPPAPNQDAVESVECLACGRL